MKRWIRWQGLVPFVAITAAFAVFWIFFVDRLVERLIEKTGSSIVGAKVELGGADVHFFPLGIDLYRLQVTHPQNYMMNAVEAQRLTFDLDGLRALERKVIINEMSITGMRFGTPRDKPGDIPRSEKTGVWIKETAKEAYEELELPSFTVPDVKKILAEEDLESLKLVEKTKSDALTAKDKWQARLEELPTKETFEQYKRRIQKLQKTANAAAALNAVSTALDIQKEIKRTLNILESAQDDLKQEVKSLESRVREAAQAPLNDVKRLQDKYGLSPEGLANLSARLLGPKVGAMAHESAAWYRKLSPYLARSKEKKEKGPEIVKPARGNGVDVRFKEREPLPEFLIRLAMVSLSLGVGDFSGEVRNITGDQDVLGKPLTLAFGAEKLEGIDAIALAGEFNHIVPAKASDEANLSLKGLALSDYPLSSSRKWPVALRKGFVDFGVRARIRNETLDASLSAALRNAALQAEFASDHVVARTLAETIESISHFQAEATLKGSLDDFGIEIRSDLDRILKQAVGRLIEKQMAELEQRLMSEIRAKVDGPLSQLKSQLGAFGPISDEIKSRMKLGTEVLGMKVGGKSVPLPGGVKLPF